MAKINISFDTKDKSLAVTIDGKAVDNVVAVDLYQSYDDQDAYRFSLVTGLMDEETDIRTMTQLMAAESAGAKGDESKEFPGFVVSKSTLGSKVHQDIATFFKK